MRDTILLLVMILCAVWAALAGQYGFDLIFHNLFKGSGAVVPVAIIVLMFIFKDKIFSRTSETTPTVKSAKKKETK